VRGARPLPIADARSAFFASAEGLLVSRSFVEKDDARLEAWEKLGLGGIPIAASREEHAFDPSKVEGLRPIEEVAARRKSRDVRGPTLVGRVSPTIVQPLDDPRSDPLLTLVANAHGWTVRSPRPPGKKTDVEGAAIPLTPWWRIALDVGRAQA
jgi:hypothetical protein